MSRSRDPALRRVRIRSLLLTLAAAAFLVLLPARPAAAHAVLVASEPANGAAVALAPRFVLLRFSEDVSAGFSSASLVDQAGRTVAGTRIATDRGGPRLLALELPALGEATYGIAWRVLAEDDGHTTSGLVVFTVGNPPRSPGGSVLQADETGGDIPPQDVVRRWLSLCLLAGLIGGLAFAGVVLRPVGSGAVGPAVDDARRRVITLAAGAGSLAALVGFVDLVSQVRQTGAAGSSMSTVLTLVSDTRWGHLWLAREAVLVALVALAVALLRTPTGPSSLRHGAQWTAVGLLIAAQVVVEALGSHAMAVEAARTAAVAAIAVHALGACLWLGGMAALVVVVARPGAMGAGRDGLLRAVAERFTVLAVASVGLAAATGLYSAGREVGSPEALVDTPYGRTLLIKTAVLLVLGGLGLVNSARLHGWVPTRRAAPPSRRLLSIEAGTGAVLLLLASVLGQTPPSRGTTDANTEASTAVTRTARVDDIVVSVSVTPNRPGANGFTVLAVSGRRPPPAPIDNVTLTLDSGSTPPALQQIEPGRYLGTADLSAAGPVRATVVIERDGARLTVPVEWSVSSIPAPSAAASRDGLAPIANGAAAVVLGILAALAAWWVAVTRRRQRSVLPAREIDVRTREDVR